MNHNWTGWKSQGVTGGSGRPHGVDSWRACKRCGVEMGSGPQSTHTGARVIRRWHIDAHGNREAGWAIPTCGGAR